MALLWVKTAVALLWQPMQPSRVHSEEMVSTWLYCKAEPISLQQPGQIAFLRAAWQQPSRDIWFDRTISLTFKCYCVSGQKRINQLGLSVIRFRSSPSWCVAAANIWETPSSFTEATCDAFPTCCFRHGIVPPCKAATDKLASHIEVIEKHL